MDGNNKYPDNIKSNNTMKQYIRLILFTVPVFLLLQACNSYDVKEPSDEDMTFRQLNFRYYLTKNFSIGVNGSYDDFVASGKDTVRTFLAANFPAIYVDTAYMSQGYVLAQPGGTPKAGKFREFMVICRNRELQLFPDISVYKNYSSWVANPSRTAEDLDLVLNSYIKLLCGDFQLNADIVRYMNVAEEKDYAATPWGILGTQNIEVDKGNPSTSQPIPTAMIKIFQYANKYAPDVRTSISIDKTNFTDKAWIDIKNHIQQLRNIGLKVHAINWKPRLPIGWEKSATNMRQLELMIDWCFQNNVEFHVTNFEVQVTDEYPIEMVEDRNDTRTQQATTYNAVLRLLLNKTGKGVNSVYFYGYDRFDKANTSTCGGIFSLITPTTGGNSQVEFYPLVTILKQSFLDYSK